jgi:hypothetical protein
MDKAKETKRKNLFLLTIHKKKGSRSLCRVLCKEIQVGGGGRLCIDRVPLPSDPYFRNSSDQFPQKDNPKFRVSSSYRTSANTHNRILSERKRKGLSSMHIICGQM